MKSSTILIIAGSLIALGLVIWWDWSIFSEVGIEMPAIGWVALVLGVLMTIVVGCGLMFLVFYSNRHGYDEGPRKAEEDLRGRSDMR